MRQTDLKTLQACLSKWQACHADVESLRAAYRCRLLDLTLRSMAFAREPVDPGRLKEALARRAQNRQLPPGNSN